MSLLFEFDGNGSALEALFCNGGGTKSRIAFVFFFQILSRTIELGGDETVKCIW